MEQAELERDEILSAFGELVSYTMNVAKQSKDRQLKEKIFQDMRPHIDLFNRMNR